MNEIVVDSAETVHAQTNHDVRVRAGGRLSQHGQLNGDVTVEDGGWLDQHGQLNGQLQAFGSVRLWGQVNGSVRAYEGSDVQIAEGVMINDEYVGADGTFQQVPKGEVFATSVGPAMWRLEPDGRLTRT